MLICNLSVHINLGSNIGGFKISMNKFKNLDRLLDLLFAIIFIGLIIVLAEVLVFPVFLISLILLATGSYSRKEDIMLYGLAGLILTLVMFLTELFIWKT